MIILERIFPLSTAFFTKKFKSTFLGRQKELRAQIFTQVRSLRVFWKSDVDFSKSNVDFQKFWYFEKKIGNFQKISKIKIFDFLNILDHFIRSLERVERTDLTQ